MPISQPFHSTKDFSFTSSKIERTASNKGNLQSPVCRTCATKTFRKKQTSLKIDTITLALKFMVWFIEITIRRDLLWNTNRNKGENHNVVQKKTAFELLNDLETMLQDRKVLSKKWTCHKVTQTLLEILSYKTAVLLNQTLLAFCTDYLQTQQIFSNCSLWPTLAFLQILRFLIPFFF